MVRQQGERLVYDMLTHQDNSFNGDMDQVIIVMNGEATGGEAGI